MICATFDSLDRSWSFEPSTRRVTELYVNSAYCRMANMPAEELLSRVAGRDLPERFGRLEHLCLFLDTLHSQLREEHTQYYRWQVSALSSPALART